MEAHRDNLPSHTATKPSTSSDARAYPLTTVAGMPMRQRRLLEEHVELFLKR